MKRLLIATIACGFLFTSCSYIINSMIYSGKTQNCYLIKEYWDTLEVFSEYGSSYDEACEDCYSASNLLTEENEFYDYSCYCETIKDDD